MPLKTVLFLFIFLLGYEQFAQSSNEQRGTVVKITAIYFIRDSNNIVKRKAKAEGTAFAINYDGSKVLATALHVVNGADIISYHLNGASHKATLFWADCRKDLAILKPIEPFYTRYFRAFEIQNEFRDYRNKRLKIWSSSENSNDIDGNSVTINDNDFERRTLEMRFGNRILSEDHPAYSIQKQRYPSFKQEVIFYTSEVAYYGSSGGPIIDPATNKVVAVVNGSFSPGSGMSDFAVSLNNENGNKINWKVVKNGVAKCGGPNYRSKPSASVQYSQPVWNLDGTNPENLRSVSKIGPIPRKKFLDNGKLRELAKLDDLWGKVYDSYIMYYDHLMHQIFFQADEEFDFEYVTSSSGKLFTTMSPGSFLSKYSNSYFLINYDRSSFSRSDVDFMIRYLIGDKCGNQNLINIANEIDIVSSRNEGDFRLSVPNDNGCSNHRFVFKTNGNIRFIGLLEKESLWLDEETSITNDEIKSFIRSVDRSAFFKFNSMGLLY